MANGEYMEELYTLKYIYASPNLVPLSASSGFRGWSRLRHSLLNLGIRSSFGSPTTGTPATCPIRRSRGLSGVPGLVRFSTLAPVGSCWFPGLARITALVGSCRVSGLARITTLGSFPALGPFLGCL